MPTYEYQCNDCSHRFETWHGVNEPAPDCPECGSDVRKVFHPPRIIFKGSGFYVTDLRAEKAAREGKKPEESSASSSSSSSSSAATPTASPAANSSDSTTATASTSGSNGSSANGAKGS